MKYIFLVNSLSSNEVLRITEKNKPYILGSHLDLGEMIEQLHISGDNL